MTREEAIEFGNMWIQVNEDCKDSSTYEFFNAALEALKIEPRYDCVSRQAVEDAIENTTVNGESLGYGVAYDILYDLPPVTPQPKTGHWIKFIVNRQHKIRCDQCDYVESVYITHIRNFCPNCGCKMVDAQESEE